MGRTARANASGAGAAAAIGAALWTSAIPALSVGAAASAAMAAAGCTTHQCDPSSPAFGGGRMIDDNTYETNGLDEPWLPFPPNATLIVTFPPSVGVGRIPVTIDAYIGVSSTPNEPNDAGINFTTAAGALVEYSAITSAGFHVLNSTCSQGYFARFVVHFAPGDSG